MASNETPNGSASSSPTRHETDDRPSKKRRTRTGIACDSCQRRKTRCELLGGGEGAGCHRCHVLDTACSLIPEAGGNDTTRSQHPTPGPVDHGRDRKTIRMLDERTERIESALNRLLKKSSYTTEGVVELENNLRDTPHRDGGIGSTVLRALQQGVTSRWMDPVKLGLVSDKQFRQCVHQYIDQTALVFPLDSIKTLITTHATHPLASTAILIQTMPHLRPKLHKLLSANLGVADSAAPALSIFVGHLILSHIPQVKEELVTSIDVHSAAIRGMGQAMALGLDDTVHAVTQEGFDWDLEMESVERLAALYCIAHRLAWTHLFSTPGFTHQSTLPLLINVLPIATAIRLRSRLLLHLTLESILLLLLDPVVRSFRRARLERQFKESSLETMKAEYTHFQDKVSQWRQDVEFNTLPSSTYLIFHSMAVEGILAFALSSIYIPTPILYPSRMEVVTFFGGSLINASLQLIEHVLASKDLDLALVPSFHLILALVPLATLIQSGKLNPEDPQVVAREETLRHYKQVLGRSHDKVELIIRDIDNMDPPHDYSRYKKATESELNESAIPAWDLGLDQLFDVEALWPLMGNWTNTDGGSLPM